VHALVFVRQRSAGGLLLRWGGLRLERCGLRGLGSGGGRKEG
jgi:hypothetical protein